MQFGDYHFDLTGIYHAWLPKCQCVNVTYLDPWTDSEQYAIDLQEHSGHLGKEMSNSHENWHLSSWMRDTGYSKEKLRLMVDEKMDGWLGKLVALAPWSQLENATWLR